MVIREKVDIKVLTCVGSCMLVAYNLMTKPHYLKASVTPRMSVYFHIWATFGPVTCRVKFLVPLEQLAIYPYMLFIVEGCFT